MAGNTSASDEEVEQTANCANINERILTFPQQYSTVVATCWRERKQGREATCLHSEDNPQGPCHHPP